MGTQFSYMYMKIKQTIYGIVEIEIDGVVFKSSIYPSDTRTIEDHTVADLPVISFTVHVVPIFRNVDIVHGNYTYSSLETVPWCP